MYDIAVIGGGPIGSRVAYRLAGMGYDTVVVEQKDRLGGPVCCTGIISRECVDHFAIDNNLIFRQANSASVFSPSGKLLRLWRQEPQACIIDRAAFDLAFANRAQERGVKYLLNSPVRAIEVRDDSVRIESGHFGVGSDFIQARAAVVATGPGSGLVEELGLGKVSDFAMGVQAEVETSGVEEVEVYLGQKLAPEFFAWLVPTSPNRALVGLLARRRTGFYLKRLMASLAAQGKIISDEVELSFAGVPLGPLAKTFTNRIVVVGSAAGQVKPTTGGGIYYGLLCADIAADNLGRALESDDLSAKNLSGYQKDWRKRLGRELRLGHWSRKIYALMSDRRIDRIFDIMKSSGIDEELLKADDLSFDWHGKVVLKLIGHQALSRTIKRMRLPFPPGR
ncbi:MAG: NAD(P)/FAD-dependent oxidoreductase [Dehalococcoidales bacterium]